MSVPQIRIPVRVVTVDLDMLRNQLAAIEGLCHEARISRDNRVLVLAVQVILRGATEIWQRLGIS